MVTWEKLQERQKDWLDIHPEAIRRRELFLRHALSREQSHYTRAVQTIRHGRARLIQGYADIFTDRLELDSSVARTSKLERLLELAVRPGGNGKPDQQRWFEAISRFDQAVAIAQIEMQDSYEALDRDMSDLLDFLSVNFFRGGFEEVEIYCYHDKKSGYVVREEDVGVGHHLSRPGLERRKSELNCRRTVLDHLAYIRDRIKDPYETWLKTQRQIHDPKIVNPYVVNDRCGLTFIVESVDHLTEVALKLVELLLQDGAEEIEKLETNHGTRGSVDTNNKLSSIHYKAAKTLIKWRGRVFEFQFMTYHDYYTSRRSLTDANHELYRLRQTLNYFLPLLAPVEIYGIDWTNPSIRGTLRRWKIAQLGWRVNENEKSES